MKCCEESTISCCLSEESEKICPTIGVEGNCSTVILIPIISVPIQKIEIEDKLSFTNFISINGLNKIVFSNTVNPPETLPLSKPPPAYNLPLLI